LNPCRKESALIKGEEKKILFKKEKILFLKSARSGNMRLKTDAVMEKFML
jgi:hypothetical protein